MTIVTTRSLATFFDGQLYGLPDAMVGTAAAEHGAHRVANLLLGGFGVLLQQPGQGHHLPGLAVAALRYTDAFPSPLDGVRAVRRQPFDGGDLQAFGTLYGQGAGAYRFAIGQHGASAAGGYAAAEFGASQLQQVAQGPEQGHIWHGFYGVPGTVDVECVGGHSREEYGPEPSELNLWWIEGLLKPVASAGEGAHKTKNISPKQIFDGQPLQTQVRSEPLQNMGFQGFDGLYFMEFCGIEQGRNAAWAGFQHGRQRPFSPFWILRPKLVFVQKDHRHGRIFYKVVPFGPDFENPVG